MNIYSCVDTKNIDKIIVLFKSCYINSSRKEDLNFFLLIDEDTISESKLNELIPSYLKLKVKAIDNKYMIDNNWLSINDEFSKFFYKQSKCNHIMNFCRFFIFDHFPEIDTAIYLDWDMIVQDDIFKIYNNYRNCKEYNKLVVAETLKWKNTRDNIFDYLKVVGNNNIFLKNKNNKTFIEKTDMYKDELNNKIISLGYNIDMKKETFNAGFYITNNKIFEKERIKYLINTLIEIQKKYSCFRFGTQVVMNTITDNLEFVESKWNNDNLDSSIIHWAGLGKPWETEDEIWVKYSNLP